MKRLLPSNELIPVTSKVSLRVSGTIVKKSELLATFYSPDFRNAEQAYLGSLASVEGMKPGHTFGSAGIK